MISHEPVIQATGFLISTLAGLTPAEHMHLPWTHTYLPVNYNM